MERLCREQEQAIQYWRGLAERNEHSVEKLRKRIVKLQDEKSQLEGLQAEWREKAAQLEDMKDTLALRDATMEEQVRNLLREKQELQQTLHDKEKEVECLQDDLECMKMQVCLGRAYGSC